MKRRALLASLGAGTAALSGCSDLIRVGRADPTETGRWHVGERPELSFRVSPDPVTLEETLTYEVTNGGDEAVTLGCNVPWDLQRADGGDWERVAWTGGRYYQLCAFQLQPGGTHEESITLTEAALVEQTSGGESALEPGRYRLVLVGPPGPKPAVEFELHAAE